MKSETSFDDVVASIEDIGKSWHSNSIVENAIFNASQPGHNLKQLPKPSGPKAQSAIVISAGPSLHRFDVLRKIKESNYPGSIVAVDGSMIKCLKNGLVPDYVLTLDPHASRIVRWFGDRDFEINTQGDDYFSRQDLDIEFRNNSIRENNKNISLVDEFAPQIKLISCTTAPKNVVKRTEEAGFERYWWNPLVDDPNRPESMTRKLYDLNKYSCMNTGGTVGTAAWVFANRILKIPSIALTGMDLGYHQETPIQNTQTYYELVDYLKSEEKLAEMFPSFEFPLDNQTYYTDPTYFWYRKNFLQLLSQADGETINCSEAGTLFGEHIKCDYLNQFLTRHTHNG